MQTRLRGAHGARLTAVVLVVLFIVGFGTGTTYAAWSGQTANGGNSLAAKPDFVAPTVTASKIALTSGLVPGTIRPGGSYYVYANASDAGAPPSGITALVANVSNLTTGASNVALVAGSYSVGGTSYGWRSASLTADAGLANGPYTYSHGTTDVAGNNGTQTNFPVTVDAVGPAATDVQAVNGTGAADTPDGGDVITLTFSEPVDPASVLAAWDGTSTAVVVRFTRSGGAATVTFRKGGVQLPLGSLSATGQFGLGNGASADLATSTMVLSGSTITITLGGTALGSTNSTTPTTWTLPATVTDIIGNVATAGMATETGALDKDF